MSGTTSDFSQPAVGDGPVPTEVGHVVQAALLRSPLWRYGGPGGHREGLVLATAATRDHRYVIQTQTHALEETDVHGHSDVIISDDPVDYPELLGADLLVALCQWAADAYTRILRPDGVLLYDAGSCQPSPSF